MWKLRSVFGLVSVLLIWSSADLVAGQRSSSSKWQTLSGVAPLVIARGGFSGIFPDSSSFAYLVAAQTGAADLQQWCDVQLTKDGVGICFPDVMLQNASNIDMVYPNRTATYIVNGVSMQGYSSVDFTLDELSQVTLIQRIFSRSPNFDGFPILSLDYVANNVTPPPPGGLWLNVAHDAFFSQHNLSIRSYILSVSRTALPSYISSPEVGFLRGVASQFRRTQTKLVFQFLRPDDVEPTTNQTYSSLLRNLTSITTFAAGILVPKYYIWPVDNAQYLQNYTSLVLDAHRAGLEVFAYNFANDGTIPNGLSFDPVSEYLSYVDNGQFSVDGVLSDFPITPSATMDCFAHMGKNDTIQAEVLIISNEGASGDYPGCTDKAYEKAVSDGVDILDCPVQMTSDGIPFCLGSINLRDRTTIAQSDFINLTANNPDLNIENGIFTYDLTWSQIQTLKPSMYNPFANNSLFRNPRASNDGSFMLLSDFLAFASNSSSVSGVLITIENAGYLAQKEGLGITDSVADVLNKSGYNNQTSKKIMIRSSDSAVLSKFKSSSNNYELVYLVNEDIRDIQNSTILEIRKFASSMVISKKSVFPVDLQFMTGETKIVPKLQSFNLSVYVQYFQNEFVSQPWDFFSDPYVEINTHISYMGINGVITDFPATANRFRRNRCLGYKSPPAYMTPVQVGGLISLMADPAKPPALPPSPVLTDDDVTEPPLPPVAARPPENSGNGTAPGPTQPNGQPPLVASTIFAGIAALLAVSVLC